MHLNQVREIQGVLFYEKCVTMMLCMQDMLHLGPKQWYLAKQTTKVSNRIQTNFTLCHGKSKDIEFLAFHKKKRSNYIQLYRQNKTWATLRPIWFFRVRYPYDSSLVLQIKKERLIEIRLNIAFAHIFAFNICNQTVHNFISYFST